MVSDFLANTIKHFGTDMPNQVFDMISQTLSRQDRVQDLSLSQRWYQRWKKEYTFDALKYGYRYGQSFCNTFNIQDNILYYERDPERADQYIRQCYVA